MIVAPMFREGPNFLHDLSISLSPCVSRLEGVEIQDIADIRPTHSDHDNLISSPSKSRRLFLDPRHVPRAVWTIPPALPRDPREKRRRIREDAVEYDGSQQWTRVQRRQGHCVLEMWIGIVWWEEVKGEGRVEQTRHHETIQDQSTDLCLARASPEQLTWFLEQCSPKRRNFSLTHPPRISHGSVWTTLSFWALRGVLEDRSAWFVSPFDPFERDDELSCRCRKPGT